MSHLTTPNRDKGFSLGYTSLFLIAIIILAVIVRVSAAFYLGNQVVSLPGTFDQVSYQMLAERVLEGYGFTFGQDWWPATASGEPTAHWSFLYTFYLVVIYKLVGLYPLLARLFQAILVGILQPMLVYVIARRIFNHKIGLIAAALNAVYLYFIYYSVTLMTEPFYITAILACLYISIRLVDQAVTIGGSKPSRSYYLLAIALGFVLGITVLLRQLFLLVIPFLFVWIWWSCRVKRGYNPIPALLVVGFIVLIFVLPFTAYNYARFESFVLLNTNAGYAFFWANHPVHGISFISAREMDNYLALIPTDLLNLDEAALDQELLRRGLNFVIDDPIRYLRLSISRIPAYFVFWPLSESSVVSNITRVGSFGIMLPFIILGIVLWFKDRWSNGLMKLITSPGALLILFAFVYTGVHILTWALIRYRLPVDAVLLVFAAEGIAVVVSRIKLGSLQTKLDREGV